MAQPIRLVFDPTKPNGVAAAPTGAYGAGTRARQALGGVVSDAARSAGAVARRTVGINPGGPVLGAVVSALGDQKSRVAIRDFIDGLGGNPKGGRRVATPAPAPAPARPVEAALAAGRAAEPTITPYDRQLAFLDTVFRGPLTMREAAAYSNMLPARDIKTPSAKDTVLGETAKLSQAIYQNAIDQATKLAATDPEGARAITEKATDAYFARQAGLVGFNPVQLAQASLMAGADEEE